MTAATEGRACALIFHTHTHTHTQKSRIRVETMSTAQVQDLHQCSGAQFLSTCTVRTSAAPGFFNTKSTQVLVENHVSLWARMMSTGLQQPRDRQERIVCLLRLAC